MRKKIGFLLMGVCCWGVSFSQMKGDSILLADPAIFCYQQQYYLYGTGDRDGFKVYHSSNLVNWKLSAANRGYALEKGNAFGRSGFWAPQVFQWKDKFYMAYAANEQIAIATAIHPLGPFTQLSKDSLSSPVKQIDPFVFIDGDGKKYLYHVRLTQGNRIFVAEMEDDFSAIKPETLKECIIASDSWENTSHSEWPVAEGPSVLKKNNTYYLFYTANDFRNPDYAVGYATSSSPLGPWKKFSGNPVLHRKMLGVNGTGHGDLFIGPEGKLSYVFHTHFSSTKVAPRKTAVIAFGYKRGKFFADRNSFRFLVYTD